MSKPPASRSSSSIRFTSGARRLPDDLFRRIEPLGHMTHYADEEVIHQRGDRSLEIGIVSSGSVVLSNVGRNGKRITTAVLNRGETYGVFAVYTGGLRTHDATARGETEVLVFKRAAFRRMIHNDPDLSDFLIVYLSDRLERVIQLLDDERRLPLQVRLGKLLLRYSSGDAGAARVTQSDLAEQLAVSRNALGAALKELAKEGLAIPDYRFILLPSRPALRAWVDAQAELIEVRRSEPGEAG